MSGRPRRSCAAASAALAAALCAASCAFWRGPDPTRFYVLAATVPDAPPACGALAIGLGPIAMPGYLQHSGLVTRVGTEIRYADLDRWAEPLPTLFGRALGQDLAALLGARVVPYPWYRTTALDVTVRVEVTAFEAAAMGDVTLEACWSIRDASTRTACRDECASIVEAADERSAEAQVTALGHAVGELARRVASTVASCPRP